MSSTISTTRPHLGCNILGIVTQRLIIRPLLLSDLQAFYTIRSQPEAMAHSGRGRPDANIEETKDKLQRLQLPYENRHVYFGIFLKNSDGSEGNLIGDGGVHKMISETSGWPELGYKFKKDYWHLGYATEFVKGFLKFWFNLPRQSVEIGVHPSTVDYFVQGEGWSGGGVPLPHRERVCAWTTKDNVASQNVLEKAGFEIFQGLEGEAADLINWRFVF